MVLLVEDWLNMTHMDAHTGAQGLGIPSLKHTEATDTWDTEATDTWDSIFKL